jgi:hypothetical protein
MKSPLLLLSIIVALATSQAQTVQDSNSGQAYFENAARVLCGSNARVSVSVDSAFIYLSGEHLQNRNLDEVARNLALAGLNAYPDSSSFSVFIEDSKGQGSARVNR